MKNNNPHPVRWKDDIESTCPKCKKLSSHIVYLNVDSVDCGKCGHTYDVAIFVSNIELKAVDSCGDELK